MNNLKNHDNEQGFTLVEIMVTVSIIGLLAAIAIPSYLGFQRNATLDTLKADITQSAGNIDTYIQDKTDFALGASQGAANAETFRAANILAESGENRINSVVFAANPLTVNAPNHLKETGFCVNGVNQGDSFHYISVTQEIAEGTCPDSNQQTEDSYSWGWLSPELVY